MTNIYDVYYNVFVLNMTHISIYFEAYMTKWTFQAIFEEVEVQMTKRSPWGKGAKFS